MPTARLRSLAWLVLLAGCAAGSGVQGTPVPVGGFRPEDRVILGDFSRVTALAASIDRVFIAYPEGLGIWRPLERRWEVPRTPPDLAQMREVIGAAIDPLDQSLWLASRTGWLHYLADIDRWDSGLLRADVVGIVMEPVGSFRGIWFRTRTGWLVLPRVGGIASPAAPPAGLVVAPTIEEALRANPAIRVRAADLLRGERFDAGFFTAAARSSDGRGWYLGTSNHGAVWFDDTAAMPELLTLGLAGRSVGAIALSSGGVWVATDREVNRSASVALVASDLGRTTLLQPQIVSAGFPFNAVRAVLPDGDRLWLATDQGLVRVGVDDRRVETWTQAHGLPDQRVLSLAKVRGHLMVGTMRGVAEIDTAGQVIRRDGAFQRPVYALHARGDTLWLGTEDGIYALLPGDQLLQMPDGLRGIIPLRTAIYGIGAVADTIVAMTGSQLVWRNPASGAWAVGQILSGPIGPLAAFFADEHGVWVGGENGVGVARPTSFLQRPLTVPRDIPGGVTAVAAANGWLWVGTREGLVRYRLSGGR